MLEKLKQTAKRLKLDTFSLYLAARDPRTPWYARLLVAAIVAYAISPIDLIPDFIPVLGLLDELILLPIGIALAIRLTPEEVLIEARERVRIAFESGRPVSKAAAVVVVMIWFALAALFLTWLWNTSLNPG